MNANLPRRRPNARPALLTLLPALLVTLALPAAATARDHDRDHARLHLEIQGDDEHDLTLDVGGWAADLVRAAMPRVVHCDVDRDDSVVTVLRFLDRHGEGSRYTMWDEDGRELTGRRTRGRFELRVGGRHGWRHGRAHVEAPWGVARCLLGGTVAIGDLIDAGESGLDLFLAGDDGHLRLTLR